MRDKGSIKRAKRFSRVPIILPMIGLIVVFTIITEVLIDELLLAQPRSYQHVLVHSMGTIGALMAALSVVAYMVKKSWANLIPFLQKDWLDAHQTLSVLGLVIVGFHSGLNFKAGMSILTFVAFVVCVISGFSGRMVFNAVKSRMESKKEKYLSQGFSDDEVENFLSIDTSLTKALAKWRTAHRVVTLIMATFLVIHIVAALYFGG